MAKIGEPTGPERELAAEDEPVESELRLARDRQIDALSEGERVFVLVPVPPMGRLLKKGTIMGLDSELGRVTVELVHPRSNSVKPRRKLSPPVDTFAVSVQSPCLLTLKEYDRIRDNPDQAGRWVNGGPMQSPQQVKALQAQLENLRTHVERPLDPVIEE